MKQSMSQTIAEPRLIFRTAIIQYCHELTTSEQKSSRKKLSIYDKNPSIAQNTSYGIPRQQSEQTISALFRRSRYGELKRHLIGTTGTLVIKLNISNKQRKTSSFQLPIKIIRNKG